MTTQEIEDFVIEELHNYSAWVLKHPDTEPLERRAEKSRRAKLILTTLITKVREEEIKRMLQYSHIGYEFIEGVRQYANERGITNTNK